MAYGPDTDKLLRRIAEAETTLHLTDLEIHSFPPLPPQIKHLSCYECSLVRIPRLPKALESFTYTGGFHQLLEVIEGPFPAKLRRLELRSPGLTHTPLTYLPPFPNSLEELTLIGVPPEFVCPPLPYRLRKFVFSGDRGRVCPPLPVSLEQLILWEIDTCPPLPPRLEELACQVTHALPPLPSTLRRLVCSNSTVPQLPPLPPRLQILGCSNNPNLHELPPLPPTLQSLRCNYTPLSELPPLPPALRELYCWHTDLRALPPLPMGFQTLNCRNTPLQELPTLPLTCTYVNCSSTPLHTLPPLPPGLHYLNISNTPITILPPLPLSLSMESNMMDDEKGLYCRETPLLLRKQPDETHIEYARRWERWHEEQARKALAKVVSEQFLQGILTPAFLHRRIRQAWVRRLTAELGCPPTEAELAQSYERPMPCEFFQEAALEF